MAIWLRAEYNGVEYSPDGEDWTLGTIPEGEEDVSSISFGPEPGYFAAIWTHSDGETTVENVYLTTDAQEWIGPLDKSDTVYGAPYRARLYVGGKGFVWPGDYVWFSTDGQTIQETSLPQYTGDWPGATYDPVSGNWVVTAEEPYGDGAWLWLSQDDGATWDVIFETSTWPGNPTFMNKVVDDRKGRIVANFVHHDADGNELQACAKSSDGGINWETADNITEPNDYDLSRTGYSAERGTFLIWTELGIYESSDGLSWQTTSLSTWDEWRFAVRDIDSEVYWAVGFEAPDLFWMFRVGTAEITE